MPLKLNVAVCRAVIRPVLMYRSQTLVQELLGRTYVYENTEISGGNKEEWNNQDRGNKPNIKGGKQD